MPVTYTIGLAAGLVRMECSGVLPTRRCWIAWSDCQRFRHGAPACHPSWTAAESSSAGHGTRSPGGRDHRGRASGPGAGSLGGGDRRTSGRCPLDGSDLKGDAVGITCERTRLPGRPRDGGLAAPAKRRLPGRAPYRPPASRGNPAIMLGGSVFGPPDAQPARGASPVPRL